MEEKINSLIVARVIDIFYPYISGVANQAYFISKHLQQVGIKSPIYASKFYAKKAQDYEIIDGIDIHRYDYSFNFMKYIYTPRIKKVLQKENYSLIHSHNYRNYLTNAAVGVAKKRKKPVVLSVHGSLLNYQKMVDGVKRWPYKIYDSIFGRRELKYISKIIVNSKIEYESAIIFGIPKEKLEVIPVGINSLLYQKLIINEKNNEILKLLYVGRISPVRNLDPIIKAMKFVNNVKLRIVGKEVAHTGAGNVGYYDKLKRLVTDLNLNSKIEFVGAKYGEELLNEYKNSDIFIYTSFVENFGQPILEAAATGLPIISTPVGIANDIVINNKTGFLVDYNDPNQIVDAINQLRSSSKRQKFSQKLTQIVKDHFNWTDITEKYIKLYNSCL